MSNISASIDVAKIEKDLLKVGNNGVRYLDLVLIPKTNDKYGNDFMVVQSVSKEQRAAGVKGPILGNAKFFGGSAKQPPRAPAARPPAEPEDDEIPF